MSEINKIIKTSIPKKKKGRRGKSKGSDNGMFGGVDLDDVDNKKRDKKKKKKKKDARPEAVGGAVIDANGKVV